MSIIYSAVAKGTQILAQCASCAGNFNVVTAEILSKIPPDDAKRTFSLNKYHFHYVVEHKLVYFCMADSYFPQLKAFSYLNEIQKRFQALFGDVPLATLPYAALKHVSDDDFARVLESEMKRFNDSTMTLPRAKAELKELKSIMVQNVDRMAERGERLENLMNRTEGLEAIAVTYRSTSVRVQRKYWWQHMRMYIILVLVLIAVGYSIGVMACGGLAWKNCV